MLSIGSKIFRIKPCIPSLCFIQNALTFASCKHTGVNKRDMDIIYHARQSLLFSENDTWIKKDAGLFDVTMGAFDGAEVYELVEPYILSLIAVKYNTNVIGLYGDD